MTSRPLVVTSHHSPALPKEVNLTGAKLLGRTQASKVVPEQIKVVALSATVLAVEFLMPAEDSALHIVM